MQGEKAFAKIDQIRGKLEKIAKDMWDHPEGPYREFKACEWISEALKEEGFSVEIGAGGVPTAIKATWGKGSPVYGILGELDALPGMSQKMVTHKDPVTVGDYGQACGHNLLGVGSLGGAVGLKAEMEAEGLPGTVVYYGCPAEEVLTGKSFMARGGAFDDLDYSVAYHPGTTNGVRTGRNVALQSANFHFKGVTAHAGGDPYNGRSALDAAELMNVGVQFLREHVTSDVRMHYIITEAGTAPNIVPDRACNKYFVRAFTREAVEDVYKRVIKVAEGAARMTETELVVENLGGCYQVLPNLELANVMDACLREIPQEPWTAEELAYAKALNDTVPEVKAAAIERLGLPEDTVLHIGVATMKPMDGFGSTDVGDVQHIAPGVMFNTAAVNIGAPGHSWQITACTGHSIGMKGMIYACKAIALMGLKVISDPAILEAAKQEFAEVTRGRPYVCPVTEEIPIP